VSLLLVLRHHIRFLYLQVPIYFSTRLLSLDFTIQNYTCVRAWAPLLWGAFHQTFVRPQVHSNYGRAVHTMSQTQHPVQVEYDVSLLLFWSIYSFNVPIDIAQTHAGPKAKSVALQPRSLNTLNCIRKSIYPRGQIESALYATEDSTGWQWWRTSDWLLVVNSLGWRHYILHQKNTLDIILNTE